MRPGGHEVVHEVVVARYGVEHPAHAPRLLAPGHLFETEVRRSLVWHVKGPFARLFVAILPGCCAESARVRGSCNCRGSSGLSARHLIVSFARRARGHDAGRGLTCQVLAPVRFLVAAQLVQVLPGVQAGVVPVIEHQLDRILPDRLDDPDTDSLLSKHQLFLARSVALHFRGRRMDTQVLEWQLETTAVLEAHLEHSRCLTQFDFCRFWVRHISLRQYRQLQGYAYDREPCRQWMSNPSPPGTATGSRSSRLSSSGSNTQTCPVRSLATP